MGKQKKVIEDRPQRGRQKSLAKLDFDALDLAIVDGKLAFPDATLVLKRAWRTDKSDITSICHVSRIDGDMITLRDETMEQDFLFSLTRDVGIYPYLRVFDRSRTRKVKQGLRNRIIKKLRKTNGKLSLTLLIEQIARTDDELADVRSELLAMTDDGVITVIVDDNIHEPVAVLRDLDTVADQKRVDLLTTDEKGEVGSLVEDEQGDADQAALGVESSSS